MTAVKWVPVGTVSSAPESSGNNNSLVIFNGNTGYIITASGVQLVGNTFSSINANEDLVFQPTGTGVVSSPSSFETNDKLIMIDSTGIQSVSLQAPSVLDDTYSLKMPLSDGFLGEVLSTDGAGNLYWANVMSGFITGPVTSTNNAVSRWNGTAGIVLDDSGVIIDNSNNVTGMLSAAIGNISIVGDTISTTDMNGSMTLSPNGTGSVFVTGPLQADVSLILQGVGLGAGSITLQAPGSFSSYSITLPVDDGSAGQILTTDGTGVLSWTSNGNGDVNGPIFAVDNAVVRFDSTTGKLIKNSGVIIDNSDNMSGVATLLVNGTITTRISLVMEDPGAGTNTVTLQAPTLAGNYTLTFPVDDGLTGQVLITDGAGVLSWFTGSTGTVTGPISSTDNALARWDMTSGTVIQNSLAILDDLGALSGLTLLNVDNLQFDVDTISTTDTNGNLIFAPNGTGITTSAKAIKSQTSFILEDPGAGTNVVNLVAPTLSGDWTFTFPTTGGTNNYVLVTNGSGVTSWSANPFGAVVGPGSSTDTAIVRFNGTSGLLVQNSGVLIDGSNNITGATTLTTSGALRSNTSLILEDPGAGTNTTTIQSATLGASYTITLPTSAGTNNFVLTTNGSGVTSWTANPIGAIIGPGSSTDTAIVLFNGTTGLLAKNSVVTITTGGIIDTTGAQINFSTVAVLKTVVADFNLSVGQLAMPSPTVSTGIQDTAVGYKALNALTTSVGSVGVGYQAGVLLTSGNHNTLIGNAAGSALTTQAGNTFIGYNTGLIATSANNTMLGDQAGIAHTSGTGATYLGWKAGNAISTSNNNTLLGNSSGILTTGANNTYVGSLSGATGTSGHDNVVIGSSADIGAANNYSIVLGSGAVATASNQFVVGSATGGQGVTTTTTGGTTNGTATALTLLPLGYWTVRINGTNVNIPYYSLT